MAVIKSNFICEKFTTPCVYFSSKDDENQKSALSEEKEAFNVFMSTTREIFLQSHPQIAIQLQFHFRWHTYFTSTAKPEMINQNFRFFFAKRTAPNF